MQDRIGEQTGAGLEPARDFVLVGMGALEQAHRRDGGEDPASSVTCRDVALHKKRAALGIKPAGEEVDGDTASNCRARLSGPAHSLGHDSWR